MTALGTVQAFPRILLTRSIFKSDTFSSGRCPPARRGDSSTLTLKQVTNTTVIDGTTEIEAEVSDLHAMAEVLHHLGLREARY
ncbi:hypothetical protein [Planomonospora venezuelensis]|uniref:Adenylate cyclase class IV n=1 Tax=Planomonospora venezuelensis TaxID=1999 RepID=A0A841DDI9_PLAVE|nr:hypothetical protein [Planomonospora venezuelensis]MBB5965376.1 adenylate cyclase class IV [Planomonospora venezuelensis]GIN05144.1 hypothetical protein Pve01_68020 [Planomonospora venezuelensis]